MLTDIRICLLVICGNMIYIQGHGEKRLLLHSETDIAAAIQELETKFAAMEAKLNTSDAFNSELLSTENSNLKLHITQLETKLNASKATLLELQQHIAQLETQMNQGDAKDSLMNQHIAQLETKDLETDGHLALLEDKFNMEAGKNAGTTYVRWGKTTCPGNGTTLVYDGFGAGGGYEDTGASVNYICLPKVPSYDIHHDGLQQVSATIYGAEYETGWQKFPAGDQEFLGQPMNDHNMLCAVCLSSRPTVLMIPGRKECYSGWTFEYSGYLVSGYNEHKAASSYACLDKRPVFNDGSSPTDDNGKLVYIVEAKCGALSCPPYTDGREIACVVCSK